MDATISPIGECGLCFVAAKPPLFAVSANAAAAGGDGGGGEGGGKACDKASAIGATSAEMCLDPGTAFVLSFN